MSIKTALGAFGVSMLAASTAMAGGLGSSDTALKDYVTNIQGADQMSVKQMEETKGTLTLAYPCKFTDCWTPDPFPFPYPDPYPIDPYPIDPDPIDPDPILR
jgi:hypothetical protein